MLVLAAIIIVFLLFHAMAPRPEIKEVVLNELVFEPEREGWRGFVEIYNNGADEIELEGWRLSTQSGSMRLDGVIKPDGHRVYYGELADLPAGKVMLKDPVGRRVDSFDYGVNPATVSAIRFPDGVGYWTVSRTPTPGKPNMERVEKNHLTSTTCMVDEYRILQRSLDANGFGLRPNEFCHAADELVGASNPVQSAKAKNIADSERRKKIVYVIAVRSKAAERQERTRNLTVPDWMLLQSIDELLDEDVHMVMLSGEFKAMNRRFKSILYDVLENGSELEKSEIKLQLTFYLDDKGKSHEYKVESSRLRFFLKRNYDAETVMREIEE